MPIEDSKMDIEISFLGSQTKHLNDSTILVLEYMKGKPSLSVRMLKHIDKLRWSIRVIQLLTACTT